MKGRIFPFLALRKLYHEAHHNRIQSSFCALVLEGRNPRLRAAGMGAAADLCLSQLVGAQASFCRDQEVSRLKKKSGDGGTHL